MEHPGKVSEKRNWFDHLAERLSNFTSRLPFFVLCLILTAIWLWAEIEHQDRLAHILIGAVALLTLIKVGLLANAERRTELAVQEKLDQLLEAQAKALEAAGDQKGARELKKHQQLHEEI